MIPNLTALVLRLAWSPLPARLLALGGMLSALTLTLVALDLVTATAWAARIGILLGGGAAMMTLPKWLGWPDRTLSAAALVVLVIVLGSRLLLVSSLPAQTVWALRANEVWLVLVLGSCALLLFPGFLSRRSSLFGTLASGFSGLLLVSVGAECIGVGAMAWGDLAGEAASELSVILFVACAVWIGAFLLNRLEAGGPYRRAGRLLALRSVLLRLGGVMAGMSAGVSVVPAATDLAWASTFATPLEGMAAAAGYWSGALTGGLLATTFAVLLPRLLARLQLSGLLAASAAGESGWLAALAFLPVTAAAALASMQVTATTAQASMQVLIGGIVVRVESLPYVWPIIAAVLAHTLIRLLLGRVPESSATQLWVFLPEVVPAPATLACALQAAREWSFGPVTVVAPPPVAPRVRGAHLRLAQQAGLLPALFADPVARAADWQRMRLPSELAWSGLPCCELYGGAAAWQAAVDELQNNDRKARVLVIDGNSTPGWGAAFWKALPAGSELLARQLDGVPETGAGVVRDSFDFAQASLRSAWLAGFRQRNAPRPRAIRRLLVVHHQADVVLAQRLATAVDEQIDQDGAQVVASTLDAQSIGPALLQMDSRSWESAFGLSARLAAALGAEPGAGLSVRLSGVVAGWLAAARHARIELVVLESVAAPIDGPSIARGLERGADALIALLPADADDSLPRLYAPAAYTGALRLPPPSAQDEQGLANVARRLLNGDGASATPVDAADTALAAVS